MNRRQALSLLAAFPFVTRLRAQTRPTAQHRVFLGTTCGFLLEPGGTLKAWSANIGRGEESPADDVLGLGHNRAVDFFSLYPVAGVSSVIRVAVGTAAYAVLADGRLLAWGPGANGILGNTPLAEFETRAQPRPSSNTPAPLAVTFDAMDVASRADHVIALARDGTIYTWGRGDAGQLGVGPLPVINFRTRTPAAMPYMPFPVRVPDLGDVVAISAGNRHSLALLKDGSVRAWGDNTVGQLGDGTRTRRDRPVPVQGVRGAIAIAAGADFSAAVLADGTAMDWGANYAESVPRPVPRVVAGARGLRSIVAGWAHVVGLTETGAVMTWGATGHYEVGRGKNASPAPGLVPGLTNVQSIAAAGERSVVVLSSGRMMTWGSVREWTRPDEGGATLSPSPILLWLDGLDQS